MNKHLIAILAAGGLWGLMGLFSRKMLEIGFDAPGTLIIRCALACLFFGLTILVADKKLFKIKLRDLWCFLGGGICSLLFFTYCYIQAISLTSLSTAAILLYTAPSMVMIMSLIIFREKLTANKIAAVILAFIGCCLVSGIGGASDISAAGIAYGLCSGFGYALYSIFARLALNKGYDSRTVNFYTTLIAVIGAILIWGPAEPVKLMFSSGTTALWCVGTGLITCYLPYLLYTYGLSAVEAGKASVMASVEPVVATITGVFIFNERLSTLGAGGILLVLGAIVILNRGGWKNSIGKAES